MDGTRRRIHAVATWVAVAALALGSAVDAHAAARRGDDPAAPPETPGCVGPFTPAEVELYEALAAARERVEAAAAAVAIREQLLEAREERLVQRFEELVALEARIEERLEALERDERRLARAAEGLAERETAEAAPRTSAIPSAEVSRAKKMNAAQLAVMVRSMKPAAAGELLTQLPSGLSTEVLSRLPARKAGRILSSMDPDAATGLSVAFVHRRPADAGDDETGGGTP